MDYRSPEFWIQFGALGILAGLMTLLYMQERKARMRAERRLEAKSEKWLTMYHGLAEGLRKSTEALERRFPEEE